MNLTSMTVNQKTKRVAFTLAEAGQSHQYTIPRKAGESLGDVAARVEDWVRMLKTGEVKPLNSCP